MPGTAWPRIGARAINSATPNTHTVEHTLGCCRAMRPCDWTWRQHQLHERPSSKLAGEILRYEQQVRDNGLCNKHYEPAAYGEHLPSSAVAVHQCQRYINRETG